MGQTYYVQLLRAYRWEAIMAALDAAIVEARELLGRGVDTFPSDGVFVKSSGVMANATLGPDDDEIVASVYLGRCYTDSPSGRFYAPWSAVTESLREKDARWWEAFEKAAAKFGLTIANGEGDPTDTFVYRYEPIEDPA